MVRADNLTESTTRVWTETGAQADRFQNFFLERYREAYRQEMAHFAEIVRGRAEPRIGYADGLAARDCPDLRWMRRSREDAWRSA